MKRTLLLLIAVLLLLSGNCLAGASRPDKAPGGAALVGQPAPDFQLKTVDGRSIRLSDLKGKVVLVNFWATWCPPCKQEMPSMERLYARLHNQGLEILAVNIESDGDEVLPEFLRQHPHTFPILMDLEGDVQQTYGVFRFPETFVVDKTGKVVQHIIGGRDWTSRDIVSALKKLLQ